MFEGFGYLDKKKKKKSLKPPSKMHTLNDRKDVLLFWDATLDQNDPQIRFETSFSNS